MRPGTGYLMLAAAAAIAVPVRAHAQDSTDADRRQSALVLDHTFNAPIGEPVRVFLAKDMTYHAEVQGTGIQLQLKPLLGSTQLPLVEPLLAGESAGSEAIYVVKPRADAVYVFTTIGGDPMKPVNLRVYAMKTKEPKKP